MAKKRSTRKRPAAARSGAPSADGRGRPPKFGADAETWRNLNMAASTHRMADELAAMLSTESPNRANPSKHEAVRVALGEAIAKRRRRKRR